MGIPVTATLLDLLDPRERREVLGGARRRRFRRGEVVFHEGDPGNSLHVVTAGHAAVKRTTPLGDVGILLVLGPGDLFGELAELATANRNATVACLDSLETLVVPYSTFAALRAANPRVDRFLVERLAAEVRRLSAALMEALYLPVERRLLRRLADLARVFGPGPDGSVTIPVTQEELAHMVGATRPTTNQLLKEAESAAVLRLGRGRIVIPDLLAFEQRAG